VRKRKGEELPPSIERLKEDKRFHKAIIDYAVVKSEQGTANGEDLI
jgi:hypothetical protein